MYEFYTPLPAPYCIFISIWFLCVELSDFVTMLWCVYMFTQLRMNAPAGRLSVYCQQSPRRLAPGRRSVSNRLIYLHTAALTSLLLQGATTGSADWHAHTRMSPCGNCKTGDKHLAFSKQWRWCQLCKWVIRRNKIIIRIHSFTAPPVHRAVTASQPNASLLAFVTQ